MLPLSCLSQISSWAAFIDWNSEQIAWEWLRGISWPLKPIILENYTTKSIATNPLKPLDVSWTYSLLQSRCMWNRFRRVHPCWSCLAVEDSKWFTNWASINLVELLASIFGLWIDQLEQNLPPLSCCLCESDSTSATAWLCQKKWIQTTCSPWSCIESGYYFDESWSLYPSSMDPWIDEHHCWLPKSRFWLEWYA